MHISAKTLPQSLNSNRPDFLRPPLEAVKITAALFEGFLRGPAHALHSLSTTGAPLAISGTVCAYALNSGKSDSFLKTLPCWIDSLPQTWFFCGLIKGPLLHELYDHPFNLKSEHKTSTLSELKLQLSKAESDLNKLLDVESQSTADKTFQEKDRQKNDLLKAINDRSIAADKLEELAFSMRLVNTPPSKEYSPTVLKIAEWSSSIFTIGLLGTIVHHALDSTAYQELTFSQYLENHLLDPIQHISSAFKSLF